MKTKFSFFKGAGTVLALFLFLTLTAQAQTVVKVFGYCERGGQRVMSGGSQSQTTVQKTYPGCTVRVMDTGTATLTAIYTNTGLTVKSNPFVADTTTGYWEFYVAKASRLDIQLSGGITPNNIATPFYWAVDMSASGEALPTIYNQSITTEVYDSVPTTLTPPRTIVELNDGLQVSDDASSTSSRLKTKGTPTGKFNVVTDGGGNQDTNTITGTISAGSTSLVVNRLRNFKPGMYIAIKTLGVAGATFFAKITAINRATKTFTLDAAPAGNGTNVTVYPDNFVPIQTGLNQISGSVVFPAGFYRVFNEPGRELVLRPFGEGNPTIIESDGKGAAWIRAMGTSDLFRATPQQQIDSLQVKNITFDTDSSIRATSTGWAFNLAEASVANFPRWQNVQITGFRGGIYCSNCQGGGVENSVFRGNKLGQAFFMSDRTTWIAGNEPNVLNIVGNQFDAQADPNTETNTAVTGLSMVYEPDGSVTSASYILTASSSVFTADHVGRLIRITGVDISGGDIVTMIMSYISSTQVKVATRGCRISPAWSGASGTIYRAPLGALYLLRSNYTTVTSNIFQGNYGSAPTEVNTLTIERSTGVVVTDFYSEQGGASQGAHARLINAPNNEFHGFKSNSQGACSLVSPTSHCWNMWLTNSPGTLVTGMSGSLSILTFKRDNTDTTSTVKVDFSDIGNPDFFNESGPQWVTYGDHMSYYQWGDVNKGTGTLYDSTYGTQDMANGYFRDGLTNWTTVLPGSITAKSDGADDYKYYVRVDTTGIAAAGATTVLRQTVTLPDTRPNQNYVLGFDFRPVTFAGGGSGSDVVDISVIASGTGSKSYNYPTTLRWGVYGDNAQGYVAGQWYRGQVNLILGTGTSRTFTVEIRSTRGPTSTIVDFTNFRLQQGNHVTFTRDQPITAEKGGKVYGDVYLPNLASGSDQGLIVEATTGKLKTGSSGGSGTVTSVQASVPAWLTVASAPITSSGTITINSNTVCANCALIGPNGVTGTITARALIEADLPGLTASKITSGVLAIARGGTGLSAAANNSTIVGDGTSWNSTLLPSCSNGTTDKLLYNNSTRSFSCGVDQFGGGGSGITTFNTQTGSTQTLAVTNDTNITGSWSSAANTHTLVLGFTGRLDPTRLDTHVVYNQSTNTYTGGDQDMRGAANFYVPVVAGYAPAASGVFGYDSTAHLFVGGQNGTSKKFVTTANSLGQVTNADVASAAAIALSKLAATTASRALVSDASGFVSASTTTATQIGYLSTTTSDVQTQLNGKQATGNYITGLTGDVTATGPGSVAATIAAGSVSLSKMANLAANSIIGNNTGSAATPIALTTAQTRNLLTLGTADAVTHGSLTLNPPYSSLGLKLNMTASGATSGDFLVGQEFNFTDTQTGNRLTAQPFRFNYNRNAGATGQPSAYDSMMVLVPTVNQNLTSNLYGLEIGGNFGTATISKFIRVKFTTNPGLITDDVAIGSDAGGGNFGFGTISPTAKTHIVAESNSQTGLKIENTASATVPAAQITSPTAIAAIRTPNQTSSNSSSSGHATTTVQVPIGVDSNGDYKPAQKLSMPGVTNSGTANGDIWFNGNVFGFREKGVSKSLPYVSRVSTNYSVTSSTTLADITGLTFDVEVGRIYSFYADIFTTSSASGGVKFSIGGTATASSVIASAFMYQGSSTSVGTQRVTAMNTVFGDQTSVSSADVTIRGTFHAATAGTVTLRFAQNASNGTPSVVLAGSTFGFIQVQ